ncbi:MAG: hypothetical protein Q4A62_02230 [Eikenella sp.]|nr:hypothetical protein [Eikenella sp.]
MMKLFTPLSAAGLALFLAACATPESRLADARNVFDSERFISRCSARLAGSGTPAQVRQVCRCTRSHIVRHYRTPEQLAQSSRSEFDRVGAAAARRCAAQVRRR